MEGFSSSSAAAKNLDTIPKRVQHWSETVPDREMFVFYNGTIRQSYTFQLIVQMAGKFASRLRREYGFHKGDVIANTLPNSPERVITDLGIILAGCVCMNRTVMFSDGSNFLDVAQKSGLSAVVVCPEGNSPDWRHLKSYNVGELSSATAVLKTDKMPMMTTLILISRDSNGNRKTFLQDLQESNDDIFVEPNIQADDIMYILTTSGTTGHSKLVPKSHKNMIDYCSEILTMITQQSRHDWKDIVFYNDRPIGWSGGFPYGTYLNAETRVLLDTFDAPNSKGDADLWSIIFREKVSYSQIMAADLEDMKRRKSSKELVSYKVKLAICGGLPITKGLFSIYSSIADEVAVVYATTETSALTMNIVRENDFKDYFCGQLKPGIEIRIVDENGRECEAGQIGNLHVRGKGVFKGYLNRIENPDPNTLSAFTKDGWLNLKDVGFFDTAKNLYVVCRANEGIVFGGVKIYPCWLEPILAEHPDVAEAVVVPVSDPVLYQNMCAVIKPVPGSDLTEEKLKTFYERHFLQYTQVQWLPVPKFYMIVEDFPKTFTSKIDRVSLQKMAETTFGRQ